MNIKSLLLGSAAALLAVSGARAADAVEVVAEPEPMEYVRVCDTYGTGYFYIPGTETCLRIGGYVRYDIGVGALGHEDVTDKKDLGEDGVFDTNDTYYKRARLSLILDARTETELGTLRGFGQVHFQHTTASNEYFDGDESIGYIVSNEQAVDLNHAYIELGGFRVGHTDSWFDTFTNSAGNVINDDLISYAPASRTNQIGYRFDGGNGFTAVIAVEAPTDGDSSSVAAGGLTENEYALYTLDSYVPNVVGGIGYTGGWGGITAVAGYDSVWEEFAGKVRADVNVNEQLSLFVMGGWQSADRDEGDSVFDGLNFYGQWGGDWAIWGGASYKLSDKATLNGQLSYDDAENFSAVANVNYEVVPGFTVTPELVYVDNFDDDNDDDGNEFGGFLRFQRNF